MTLIPLPAPRVRHVGRKDMDEAYRALRSAQTNVEQRLTTHTRTTAIASILNWRTARTEEALTALHAAGRVTQNARDGSWWTT